mgnify:CR=1 FL=1
MEKALKIAEEIDERACLDVLSELVQFKSYSETDGERDLAHRMVEIMSSMGLEEMAGVAYRAYKLHRTHDHVAICHLRCKGKTWKSEVYTA